MRKLTITLLIDNPRSWFVPYGAELGRQLIARGHNAFSTVDPQQIACGDIAFFLSCEQIIKKKLRDRNVHNIVIHASALPKGKGWSPLTWQILEGKNEIPITLFEATDKLDAGDVYARATVHLEGHELIDEIREKEGDAIVALALQFVDTYPRIGMPQEGEDTIYARRTPGDSELDPRKSLEEQFNLLRVIDNDRYPGFFKHKNRVYILRIYKGD
jgi:methionyl-tRNA formyltransferase